MLSYENVEEREKRRSEMDQANWDDLRQSILKIKSPPLSAENQRVVSDEQYQQLASSGIAANLERFISRSARQLELREKRKAECLKRVAEIKAGQV